MELLLRNVLTHPFFLVVWGALVLISLIILIRDLATKNSHTIGLMEWIWIFRVSYSGPLGLATYFYSGRKEIPSDDIRPLRPEFGVQFSVEVTRNSS